MTQLEQTTINGMKLEQATMKQDIGYLKDDVSEIKGDIKEIKGILTATAISEARNDDKYVPRRLVRWFVASVLIPVVLGAATLYIYVKDHIKS